MLRSGLKVSIKHGNIESQNGVIIAPVIKIGAFTLRVDMPIHEELRIFLENEGMKIEEIVLTREETDIREKLLRLSGSYHITNEKITRFMAEHSNVLKDMQASSAIPGQVSFLLQELIRDNIQKLNSKADNTTKYVVENDDDIVTYTVAIGNLRSTNIFIESLDEKIVNQTSFIATGSLATKASSQHFSGQRFPGNATHGFFSKSYAAGASTYTGKFHAENAILDSGMKLKFLAKNNNDDLKLEIDENTVWAERPSM